MSKDKYTITLNSPVVRGKTVIKEVTITAVLKQAGSLRGLKIYDVLTASYDALEILLPRVTSPALTSAEIAAMDTWDMISLSNAVADFLQPSAEQKPTDTDTLSSDVPATA